MPFFGSALAEIIAIIAGAGVAGGLTAGTQKELILRVIERLTTKREQWSSEEKDVGLPTITRLIRNADRERGLFDFVAGLASFGQLIIGGLLASQVVKQYLTDGWVSALGLLVLLSTLVQRHYNFSAKAVSAASRKWELDCLERDVRLQLRAFAAKKSGAKDAIEIAESVNKRLAAISKPEAARRAPAKRITKKTAQSSQT